MLANIQYRLSCFADYSVLSYNKEDLIAILNQFSDVVLTPSTFKEVLANGLVSQRMQFVSSNGLLSINIGAGRIDVQITSNEKSGFAREQTDDIGAKLFDYLKRLLLRLGDKVSYPNRLAWYTTYVYFDLSETDNVAFRNRFLHELEFFKNNRLDDMIAQYGGRRVIDFSGRTEKINILTTINRYYSQAVVPNVEIEGYQIDYDINTWQGDMRNRFDLNAVNDFICKAIMLQKELDKEVLP